MINVNGYGSLMILEFGHVEYFIEFFLYNDFLGRIIHEGDSRFMFFLH